jgi:hypothetical protein
MLWYIAFGVSLFFQSMTNDDCLKSSGGEKELIYSQGGGAMNQVAQILPNDEKCLVEVVVHISNDLGEEQRSLVVTALEKTDGIIEAEFCPSRNHLVLAKYDKDVFTSQDVLKSFNSMDLEARLIGPI